MPDLSAIRSYLAAYDIPVLEFAVPTPTAETAAAAVGCTVGEIAKTILLLVGGEPLVVIAPGDRRVNSALLKQASGRSGKVKLPAGDEVLRHTGYAPGGVCPFLLPPHLPVYLDSGLRRFPLVYPAAGTDYTAVPLTVEQLLTMTGACEVTVCPAGEPQNPQNMV